MQNMASVIQIHNTNLLRDPAVLTGKECSCCHSCPLAEKYFSECLVYNAQGDWSYINQIKSYYGTYESLTFIGL